MVKLIAKRRFRYPSGGGRFYQPGDEVDVPKKVDADILVRVLQKASYAPRVPETKMMKPETAAPQAAPKQTYQTRDMAAQPSGAQLAMSTESQPELVPEQPQRQPSLGDRARHSLMSDELAKYSKKELIDIAVNEMVVHQASDPKPDLISKIVKHRIAKAPK
jgi:hypothetical protein